MSTLDNLAAVEKAQAISGSGVVDQLLNQADGLLTQAVNRHRGGTLSDRDAAVCVATISELRSAAHKAQHAYLKGVEAGEKLTTGATS